MIARIQWKKDYNTGIPQIDREHMKLIDMINSLFDAREKEEDSEIIRKVLFEIVDYTKYHFKNEEEIMKQLRYPNELEHERQHKVLIKQITEILQDIKSGKIDIKEDLLHVLENWFVKHVIGHDKDFGSFIKHYHPEVVKKLV